jgi:hypothetical protein
LRSYLSPGHFLAGAFFDQMLAMVTEFGMIPANRAKALRAVLHFAEQGNRAYGATEGGNIMDTANPESAPDARGSQSSASRETTAQSTPQTASYLIAGCAAGMLICYFLPWAHAMGQSISGFDLQEMDVSLLWLWVIPLSCVMAIMSGIAGRGEKIAARLAGAVPFVALAYWLTKLGPQLFQALSVGAYGSLILGLVLFYLPWRLK